MPPTLALLRGKATAPQAIAIRLDWLIIIHVMSHHAEVAFKMLEGCDCMDRSQGQNVEGQNHWRTQTDGHDHHQGAGPHMKDSIPEGSGNPNIVGLNGHLG